MTVLVVAAHPDDEVLGCGGTIARLSDEGQNVEILIAGEGITSRYPRATDADQKDVEQLQDQARAAAKTLGASAVRFAGFPDNRFDTVALLDIVRVIESVLAETQPEVVYTQHGGDLNIDHCLLFRAVLTAARPLPGSSVKTLYAFEVASSTEYAANQFPPQFRPTTFVDISGSIDRKIEALAQYPGEIRPFPHPRSAESLRAQAVRWGTAAGLEAAEAFQVIRAIH